MTIRQLALGMLTMLSATAFGGTTPNSQTESATSVPNIVGVQLLSYESHNNYAPVRSIADGDALVLADMPNAVNIEAVSADPARTGSVKFVLTGPKQISRIENHAIYTLEDAFTNFDLSQDHLPQGDYVLSVTPYAGADGTGEEGQTFSLDFTVWADKPSATVPALTQVQVLEALGNNEFAPVQAVANGDTLALPNLPPVINFEVVSADPANTGSVDLVLDGPTGIKRWENYAIYTLADAFFNLDLSAGELPAGDYRLSATPFSGPDLTGERGETLTTRFSVSASAVPAITGLQVLGQENGQWVPVRSLADGDQLVLSQLPEQINIEAVSANAADTGSVDFSLEGPTSLHRFENHAIYTLADAYYNLDLTANGLPEGEYSLRITPYSGADLTGDAGKTMSLNFSVSATLASNEEPAPAPSQPEAELEIGLDEETSVSLAPAISALQLLDMSGSTHRTLRTLNSGDNIDLGDLPHVVNFEAVSADPANTGSVDFSLEGPVTIKRFENYAIYTLANSYNNLDLKTGALPTGNYVARVTPYTGANLSGDAGATTVVHFSVSGKPAFLPEAVNDSYSSYQNKTLSIQPSAGLLSNDRVDDTASTWVTVSAWPQYGSLLLNDDGSFTYNPDSGFSGTDTFRYTLLDANGHEDTATVSLAIAQNTGDQGFTPIVASKDTRTIYVSSSEGLDANSGLTMDAPVRTLDRAFSKVRAGYPDHVLLKRGDVWVGENLSKVKSGRSKSEPAVVAFYGNSGGRPYLRTAGTSLTTYRLHNVNFIGLDIEAYKLNPADRDYDGTSANIRMIGDLNNILFEDVRLRFVEFIIQGGYEVARNVTIRRSMILDKYTTESSYHKNSRPSGIYTDGGDGLTIEDNVWDHNGWNAEVTGAGANMYNHNMYISEKNNVGNRVVVRNNIVTRASSHGIHGRPGGLYENNFFARNAISLQMGYHGGPDLAAGTFAYARDNVITEGVHMRQGVDACTDPTLCTGAIWGLWVESLGEADVRVERNIVSNRLPTYDKYYAKGIREQAEASYRDNIVYRWDTEDQGTHNHYPDPSRNLADYNASLGGERSFEAFIEVVRNRPLQQWDERYTADAINDYIRAGFGR